MQIIVLHVRRAFLHEIEGANSGKGAVLMDNCYYFCCSYL